MSNVKVITNFARLRDEELDTRAQNVIDKMTGNTNYPTPVPALADITSALTDYHGALAQALNGGTDRTAVKNEKRAALEDLLYALALHVQANAKKSLGILLSSGFEARKQTTTLTADELDKPANFRADHGSNPGSVRLSTDKVNGARTYMFEYAAAPLGENPQWSVRPSTARACLIEGLASGQQYAFRVAGVGAGSTLVYSDVIARYVP